jgi:L-alanine-DL-glutamate epimerase-like enolase superfamily enzyme
MPTRFAESAPKVERLEASAYKVPTDAPESDGTYQWQATTLVVVEVAGGGRSGLGYGYADTATATLIRDLLADAVGGRDAMDVPGAWAAMVRAVRNLGRPGIASMAISAVDAALWDLKAKLLDLPLASLLGRVRDSIPAYGSGGFTSYDDGRLRDQLGGWASRGFTMVKMKIGRDPADDPRRMGVAREAIGPGVALFIDANGALSRKHALAMAEAAAGLGVRWFEEPVSSDDLDGLNLIRDRAPAGLDVAAGEYGYDLWYFRRMLEAGAVDVLQADATRCGGITGFLRASALCESRGLPLSAHCAPSLHVAACCASPPARHLEFFHDHDRIEHLLFDGAPRPRDGRLAPDLSRPGLGLDFKRADAARFAV